MEPTQSEELILSDISQTPAQQIQHEVVMAQERLAIAERKLAAAEALNRAKKADQDATRKLYSAPKKKLTKRQSARLEVNRARRAAKLLTKRYHVDHLRWIMLRQEKKKLSKELRTQFRDLSDEFFALNALMKESALRLKNSLTSWGDSRTTQSEKALALAEGLKRGFADGHRVAKEEMAAEPQGSPKTGQ